MEQGAFSFDAEPDNAATIQERFERFHARHPNVYAMIVRLMGQWVGRSRRRWSLKGIFEVIRYEVHMSGLPDKDEVFKLNNNYSSRYARLLLIEHPEWEDCMETRELKA